VDVPVPGMVMMHDTGLTASYVVIYDLPDTVDFEMVERGMRFPFAWNRDYAPRIGLLPRDGAAVDIVWCEVEPSFVFHPMNAWEDAAGNVVLDVCRYPRMFDRDAQDPVGDGTATLDRWTINPATRRVRRECVHDRGVEFPRCAPAVSGKPYRYGYTVAVEGTGFPAINKHDMTTGQCTRHDLGPGRHAAEPFFVPRRGAAAEDDGYLLAYVYDAAREASELAIFDARDMSRPPLGRVLLPARVPFGFHGAWVADDWDGPSA
jgi:carotenoid cleavage dioxygenase